MNTENNDDVVVIAFKRLRDGGYVALDGEEQPIKAFSSYNELEWSVVMDMRKVCGGHPSDASPRFMGAEQPHPLRDEMPTQSVNEPPKPLPFRDRVVSMVSRAHR